MADQPAPAIPSGDQWSIGHGRDLAVISQVGATLRSYIHAGRPVVDGFGVDEWSHGGRGQVLAPWPNRLGDGRYVFQDLPIQVPLNEPERGNAIHGLVRWQLWQLETSHQNTVTASCRVLPTPGYPFALRLSIEYRLGRQGLTVATSVLNVGQSAAPFGIGFHPYLTVGAESIDTTVLSLPAEQRLVTDDRGLPTGDVRTVANTEFDFRTHRPHPRQRRDRSCKAERPE
jgi:galactose mutarotase-like enzyme